MKKFAILSLAGLLTLTSITPTFAQTQSESITPYVTRTETIHVDADNYLEVFEEYDIEIPELNTRDVHTDVVFGPLNVKYIDISSLDLEGYNIDTRSLTDSQVRVIDHDIQYNDDWERLNDTRKGLKYWLDVTYNLVIGEIDYVWQIGTILGLAPSKFFDDYQEGDYVGSRNQRIHNYKYAQVKPGSSWKRLVTTEKLQMTTFAQATGMDIYGNSVDEYDSATERYYSPHYFDEDWMIEKALELYDQSGILVQYIEEPVE